MHLELSSLWGAAVAVGSLSISTHSFIDLSIVGHAEVHVATTPPRRTRAAGLRADTEPWRAALLGTILSASSAVCKAGLQEPVGDGQAELAPVEFGILVGING